MNRFLWGMATSFFVILWFVVVPYLASRPDVDLTVMIGGDGRSVFESFTDHFTDWRGWNMTNDEAKAQCMKAVYIAGRKVLAKHHTAPLESPDMIFLTCMHAHKVMV